MVAAVADAGGGEEADLGAVVVVRAGDGAGAGMAADFGLEARWLGPILGIWEESRVVTAGVERGGQGNTR